MTGPVEAMRVLNGERRWSVDHGDNRELLASLPDNCVDFCGCDPPYEINFSSRKWDRSGVAYDVGMWEQVLRVLKPGAFLFAFGGTRTFHRVACAIEDAGFELRESMAWMFASGMPKSLNISKAIDKADGLLGQREIVRSYTVSGNAGTSTKEKGGTFAVGAPSSEPKELHVTRGASERSRQWDGFGTAIKPTFEPIIVARKPLDGTVAENVQKWGVGGLNIDGCRVPSGDDHREKCASVVGLESSRSQTSYGEFSGPHEDSWHEDGRFPPNAVFSHSPRCNGQCVEGCPVRLLDQQSGEMRTGEAVTQNGGGGRIFNQEPSSTRQIPPNIAYDDEGTASRIFPQFRFEDGLEFPPFLYHPKAGRAERDRGLERFARRTGGEATGREDDSTGTRNPRAGAGRTGGIRNTHPAVKPLGLLRWLLRLGCPPGGIALDNFTGSGSAGCAAVLEDMRYIGMEQLDTDAEPFVRIARARIAAVLAHDWTVTPALNEHEKQQSLFEVAS